jgi:hypothetical protein
MANKQNLILNRINTNLCEINNEYPLLKSYSIERHLCTSTSTKPLKIPGSINISQLLNRIITQQQQQQQQQKDSNKHLKNSREQTEVIELFKYQQQEETDNKLYRKRRYKLSNNEEDEKRDNTN